MARSRPDDEFEDDDRPSRRNRDADDEEARPSRSSGSRRGNDADVPAKKTLSILGVLSLICGILALILALIPCVGLMSLIGSPIGLILGIIGLILAGGSNHGKGLPTAGIIVNLLSMVVAILATFVIFPLLLPKTTTSNDVENADAIVISAAQLSREYESNVVKADATYKDKVLEVTGQVKLVSKERIGRVTVELGDKDNTIDCDFGSSSSDLAGIDVGQTITVRGKCKGEDRKTKYVILGSCKIAKAPSGGTPSKDTPVAIETAKLLKEYADDEEKANKDYKGKALEVSGTLSKVDSTDKKAIIAQFRSGAGKYLEVRLTPEASKAATALKSGQKATFKGTCAGLQDDEFILVENASIVK